LGAEEDTGRAGGSERRMQKIEL
jgi:hypothetical protein